MDAPVVERCILRAGSREAFQAVMCKPIGEFSLQAALARVHCRLHLGQVLPATAEYPELTVVDLTPATTCVLDNGSAATLIVMPPLPGVVVAPHDKANDATGTATTAAAPAENAGSEATGVAVVDAKVWVTEDAFLSEGSAAEANPALLDALLLPSGAVVRLGDEEVSCVFVVERGSGDDDQCLSGPDGAELRLRAGPSLFRNLRAAYIANGVSPLNFGSNAAASAVDYAACSFTIPLGILEPVEESSTEPLLVRGEASDTDAPLQVDRLLLCPAVDDFTLANTFGDDYADVLALLLNAAAPQLHNRFVSEGDVLELSVSPEDLASGIRNSVDGLDVAETMLKHLSHKAAEADSLWAAEDSAVPSALLTLFRVVEVRRRAGGRGFGFLALRGEAQRRQTELALVSQQRCPWVDVTPFLPPRPHQETEGAAHGGDSARFASLGFAFQARLRGALASLCAFSGGRRGGGGVLVVHGVKENYPVVFVEEAVRRVGLVPLYASAEALDDSEEMRRLLEKFVSCSAGVALVIRSAQVLAEDHPELLTLLDVGSGAEGGGGLRVIVLLYESIDPVAPAVAARATNAEGVLECGNPDEADRRKLLAHGIGRAAAQLGFHLSLLLSFDAMAAWTVGITFADLVELTEECAVAATRMRYQDPIRPVLSEQVCEGVLQKYLRDHGHNLVSTKLTPVRWSDVGGLEEAKRELRETIQLPILHPEMFANGMKRRTGVLFYGPPGCGKTLLAKAVATEMNMNFMSVKGPELINQYVGESERNIRVLFQRARDNSPCIVFFDELDALAPARGAKGDAGGAMDRIVSQLLVEVDGVGQTRSDGSSSGDVFIIGATNRPDLLDPSLLRPGRFDRLCYLGVPSTPEEQLFAIKALTRKFDLDADVDLRELIAPLDCIYTGADFFALCSDAMMFAVEEALEKARDDIAAAAAVHHDGSGPDPDAGEDGASAVDSSEDAEDGVDSAPIRVGMRHFRRARDQLKPSVTKEDLKRYEAIKSKFNS